MKKNNRSMTLLLAFIASAALVWPTYADEIQENREAPRRISPTEKQTLDRSGQPRQGIASYYHDMFSGRTMADGTEMDPTATIAASRTLPLGTRAVVVNLENGKQAEVEIRDRGPYIEGRIVDVSPKVARDLGIVEQGLAKVEVRPIEVPLADGSTRRGVMTGASSSEITASSEQ